MHLVLSLFPGIGLLDRAFRQTGFCVVASPDPAVNGTGEGIETFFVPPEKFAGVIVGSPCQAWSRARRGRVTTTEKNQAEALISHGARVILEAQPQWWIWENVPSVPTIKIEGYTSQRFDLRHDECGGRQRRRRHFQFGVLKTANTYNYMGNSTSWWNNGVSSKLIIPREPIKTENEPTPTGRRSLEIPWGKFCELADLPPTFRLDGFSKAGAYKAIRNGVPLKMGIVIARAIKNLMEGRQPACNICICGCGRPITGRQKAATPACRKRLERERHGRGPIELIYSQKTLYNARRAPIFFDDLTHDEKDNPIATGDRKETRRQIQTFF